MAQYVMSMLRVSKIVPPKRQIIKDISLSFFPGAKIGLLNNQCNNQWGHNDFSPSSHYSSAILNMKIEHGRINGVRPEWH